MPIECDTQILQVGQERFHDVDKVLIGHAFNIHNTLGRFCDERIYQNELALRCNESGISAQREVEIRVIHQNFTKSYYVDLLLDHGLIYELKTVDSLNTNHQKQLIHYLLLFNLNHGKLINFRPGSVESRFVSTQLKRNHRIDFQMDDKFWNEEDSESECLRKNLTGLLEDWGTFLDLSLYIEALLHFLSKPNTGLQPIDILVHGRVVGSQKLCLLNSTSAWHLSAARIHLPSYETHIKRLLNHTRLDKIHWINFNQQQITLKTLKK